MRLSRALPMTLMLALAPLGACDDAASPSSGSTEPEPRPPTTPDERSAIEVRDYVPGPIAMRRLTRSQYVSSIRGVFGDDLEVLPPTEVDIRIEGLLTVGAGTASVTPAGIERYEASARQVAADVLGADRRAQVLRCTPADRDAPDDDCARTFIEEIAPLVLRRSLRDGEADAYVAAARGVTETLGDFHQGLQAVLSAWLLTPDFLFIQAQTQPTVDGADDPTPTGLTLTGLTMASRLSYFLWNQGPDAALLAAALDGALDTNDGYEVQLDRLLTDEDKLAAGMRALFTDLYELDELDHVEKDLAAFPLFTSRAIEDAREQTLRTIVDHLLIRRLDYRDLFTTRKTFMTRNLGPIYNVPAGEDWAAFEFPENSARGGILSHASFLALQARASRSSPVLRGVFVLDNLLCAPIPPPPADVNFEAIAPGSGAGDTARERLAVHRADPACAGCHDAIDPIGLALENFDAVGQFREMENDALIDSGGELFGTPFGDVRGFYRALRDSPLLTRCIVDKLFMHAVGREGIRDETPLLRAIERDFADNGHDFVVLLKTIAMTHSFRATSGPRAAAPDPTQMEAQQ